MYSVGIDCVEIRRIEKSIESQAFRNRVFGINEMLEIEKRGSKPINYAVCFGAKEAFSKSLGTGISGFLLSEVELVHKDNGKPFLKLSGAAAKLAEKMCFDVSVTHTDSMVTVVVISYPEGE